MTIDDAMAGNPSPFESDVARDAPENADALIVEYANARNERERLEDLAKAAKSDEEIAEARLFDWLEKHNLKNVRHARGLFMLDDKAWSTIEDAVLAREWAEHAEPDLLTLNHSRLAVIVREALRGERDMPPGVGARFSRKINWRRT